ncbi:hypothetical protein KJF94_15970 [Pseudomonas hormoni]|uniref:Uncharacterized protein n=1 Tax=Pseudomonas hormoni TaxID=3093767 RepID=A0ABX8EQN2_9PSED|nr:hypothetical protein [Pseudomonas hormoni]QVW21411.1 hypothetical protein KJF94_15970 [Pseudomonas hormoni]
MQLTENQKTEKEYFDLFRQHCELPCGTIEFSDKPDVVIRDEDNRRILGIEIANLYNSDGDGQDSEQKQRVNRLKVIASAEKIYQERGGRSIQLFIGFCQKNPIKPKRIERIAEDLASHVLKISTLSEAYHCHDPLDPTPEISFISHDGSESPKLMWDLWHSYSTPLLNVPRVKEMIERKAKKVRQYAPCGANWLLLIVDFWDPAQDQWMHWPAEESVEKTPFDRILIFNTATGIIEVLQRSQ